MDRGDILNRISSFADQHNIPVNNLKSRITKEIAKEFLQREENTYITEEVVESAFEKVMKDFMDK